MESLSGGGGDGGDGWFTGRGGCGCLGGCDGRGGCGRFGSLNLILYMITSEGKMNVKENQEDKGMLEVLRIFEEKRQTLIGAIDINRTNARFIITTSSILFTVLIALNLKTFELDGTKGIIIFAMIVCLLLLYGWIVILLIKPLSTCKWIPGISHKRDDLVDYFEDQEENEVINRKIEVLKEEISKNKEAIDSSSDRVDKAQVLFSISIIIILLMFIISQVDLSDVIDLVSTLIQ